MSDTSGYITVLTKVKHVKLCNYELEYLWYPFGGHKTGNFYYRQASLGKLIDEFNFYIRRNYNLKKAIKHIV